MQDNVRSPTPPPLSGASRRSPPDRVRFHCDSVRNPIPGGPALGRFVPNPQRGLVTRWPRDGGGRSRPVIVAGSSTPPRGGHAWLSARTAAAFSDLGKIEEMPSRRTLGDLTSLKDMGEGLFVFLHNPNRY